MSISLSVGVPGNNANVAGGDSDGTGDAGGAEQASRKRNFAAIFGDSDNGSDGEEEAGWKSGTWRLFSEARMAPKKHVLPSGPRRPENEVTNSLRHRGVGGGWVRESRKR